MYLVPGETYSGLRHLEAKNISILVRYRLHGSTYSMAIHPRL